MKKKLKPTIGFEIHVELNTKSKMFCGCDNRHFRVKANTHTCPVCLGLPGALPVPNQKAIEYIIKIGLALGANINMYTKFDRKHYFYPDLPKGYQISQYDNPFFQGGSIKTSRGTVNLTRVHLEEDTAKLLHKRIGGKQVTLVDFNRSGVPLVEIVTEPDISSGKQATEFAQNLVQLLRYLKVSDCNMEKGTLRLEANVSQGINSGYKVEIKNLNSFKFVQKAIDYELKRQEELIKKGKTPKQETRGWDEKKNKTITQRYKEEAADYRYFPEPDIPPFNFKKEYIEKIKKNIPELPQEVFDRFVKKYEIRKDYAKLLTKFADEAKILEKIIKKSLSQKLNPNQVVGEIINKGMDPRKIEVNKFIKSLKESKQKIEDPDQLSSWVKKAIKENKTAVDDYKKGKIQAISVLIGKVMGYSKGKADAVRVRRMLEDKLG